MTTDLAEAPDNLGLVDAYVRVKRFLENEDAEIAFAFGDGARDRQRGPGRYAVWIPGDDGGSSQATNAKLGEFEGPKQRQTEPRALVLVGEFFTVYTWGARFDHVQMSLDDRDVAQYADARVTWDALIRAMFRELHGVCRFVSASWYRGKAGTNYGKCVRTVFRIDTTVLDLPFRKQYAWTFLEGLGFRIAGTLKDNAIDVVEKEPS